MISNSRCPLYAHAGNRTFYDVMQETKHDDYTKGWIEASHRSWYRFAAIDKRKGKTPVENFLLFFDKSVISAVLLLFL